LKKKLIINILEVDRLLAADFLDVSDFVESDILDSRGLVVPENLDLRKQVLQAARYELHNLGLRKQIYFTDGEIFVLSSVVAT